MQASSDIFLGWQTVEGADGVQRDYFLRQLCDWTGSVLVENIAPPTVGPLRPHLRQHTRPSPRPLR